MEYATKCLVRKTVLQRRSLNEDWEVRALVLKRKDCTSACFLRHNFILVEISNINAVFLQKRQHGI
jgi:hypothetical protein